MKQLDSLLEGVYKLLSVRKGEISPQEDISETGANLARFCAGREWLPWGKRSFSNHRNDFLNTLLDLYRKGEWGINKQTKEGQTLLHLAVLEGKADLIRDLVNKNALSLPDRFGLTPHHLSRYLGLTNSLTPPPLKKILIYRNKSEKVEPISIEEFEERLKIKYTSSLLFPDIKILYKTAKRCARKMKRPHLSQMNHWTLALYEKGMDVPRENLVYIRWINRYLGYGVFAACDIPALTFIGEYTGEVQKRNNRKDRFNDYVFSYDLCGKSTRYSINARHRGNFTRFLNHSDTPNLTSRWVIKDGITHVILFSNRLIRKGSQLTYCYGPWYWRSRSTPSPL
ncbi:MAG: SET domain-containing protein-lysine N-methyltransferase [Chlamydiia bacterium]|nr:SET domain-containing protein-lysine N-methyltransferase [Chlamydiia bacterium]